MSLQVIDGGVADATPQTSVATEEACTAGETVQPELLSKEEMIKVSQIDEAVEGILEMRNYISQLHEKVYKYHGKVCEKLGYAYSALLDAETFLKDVLNGKENFVDPPKMVELDTVDTSVRTSDTTGETYVSVPSKIEDVKYMQSWFGNVFFPELRKLSDRTDVAIEVSADKDESGALHISFTCEVQGKEKTALTGEFYAGDSINLTALAEEIKKI